MSETLLVFGVLLVVVIAVGALWLRDGQRLGDRLSASRPVRRLVSARAVLVSGLGSVWAATVILFAGITTIIAVCWPLGALAHTLERPVDIPIFEWMLARLDPAGAWARISSVLETMGDGLPMLITTTVASVIFAAIWWRRRWWIPPAVLFAALISETVVQRLLTRVVDRGHPPTAVGSYPSGATARVIAIYGVILFLTILTWPEIPRRWRVAGWTLVAVLAVIEGYSRIHLVHHWATDVVGGWIFGFLMLVVILASASALLRDRTAPERAHTERS